MTHAVGFVSQFAVLFAFWLVLTDQYRPLFFAIGAVSALVVTALTNRIVATVLSHPHGSVGDRLSRFGYFVGFGFWMLGKIIAASVQVAYFAVNPALPFRPGFVRFETTMKRPLSRVMLATAITIVPGSMTIRLDGNRFLVHALLPEAVEDLRHAVLQNKIAHITGEEPEPPPDMTWELIPEAVR
ncbi:MAG: Na+/H+ antiporter subunit E [Acidimicrobiales bacterium]